MREHRALSGFLLRVERREATIEAHSRPLEIGKPLAPSRRLTSRSQSSRSDLLGDCVLYNGSQRR